ncbi:MAG TPA: GNAT family N-acetyltransferase [Gemmatimonadaceae bacterium]
MSDASIRHEPAASRFVADVAGGEATLEYMRDGKRIIFTHTGVPPESEGKGIGASLAKAGLDWARAQKLEIVPACPFVSTYVKRHHEYDDLLGKR